MSRIIDSAALDLINTVLGITGVGETEETIIDTRNVSQLLDLLPMVRRSMVLGTHAGIWQGDMTNVHAIADDTVSTIDVYAPGVAAIGAFPSPLGKQYDVWLLSASMEETGAGGGLAGALLKAVPTGQSNQAWGINDSGAQQTGIGQSVLGLWTGLDSSVTNDNPVGIMGDGLTNLRIAYRILRGTLITFTTEAAAAATFRMRLMLGIFPVGLGQDVLT